MSEFLIKAAQLLLSLSILVVLHELGHFIPAKLFKTRVEKFYLFFDVKFSLFKKKIGDTVYGIGWLPLGGYVKISGMIDESMDTEQMSLPPQPWEFRSKPAWQRLIIMLGGVTVNFLLGFFIYMMILFVWGRDYQNTDDITNGFGVTKTMEQYGFKDGDKIVSIDNTPFAETDNLSTHLMFRKTESITVKRTDGNIETLKLPLDIGTQLFEAGDIPALSPRITFKIDSITPDSPAYKAGLLVTDKILSVDGKDIKYLSDFTYALKNRKGSSISLDIERGSNIETLVITPSEDNTIGFKPKPIDTEAIKFQHRNYGFGESIVSGFSVGYWTVKDYLAQFKYIFTSKGASQIGGFAAIGKMFPATWNWPHFGN